MKPFVQIAAISAIATLSAFATLALVAAIVAVTTDGHARMVVKEDGTRNPCLYGNLGDYTAGICLNPWGVYAGERWEVKWAKENDASNGTLGRIFPTHAERKKWLPSAY